MSSIKCPVPRHVREGDMCEENFAGLGSVGYIFIKTELSKPLATEPTLVYQFPKKTDTPFKSGCGFYRVDLRPGTQSITGESQKKNGGFKQTGQLVIGVVNEVVAELLRALNNRDWAYVIPDGDKWQCMYLHNSQKITLDAGALKTETGAQASDDRQATLAPVLENCYFPNTWIEFATGESPEDFLAPEPGATPPSADQGS